MTAAGIRRSAIILLLSAAWSLALCAPAFAHARLVDAVPNDGDTLAESPEQLRLRFNEPVEAEFSPLKVYDEENNRVDQDNARVAPDDPETVVVGLETLPEGDYTVDWRVTSEDGHPIGGAYAFSVESSAAAAEGGAGDEQLGGEPVEQDSGSAQGLAWVALLAVLVVGAAAVGFVVLRQRRHM